MTNKLYCTFVKAEEIENNINYLINDYHILYNKIFVLESKNPDYDKFILTYNIDNINLKEDVFFKNTINVHRKKETNTLYTINAINIISIQKLGRIDTNFRVNWDDYKNCLLLSKDNQLITIPTYLNKIVEF
jgi:hypothetical protein